MYDKLHAFFQVADLIMIVSVGFWLLLNYKKFEADIGHKPLKEIQEGGGFMIKFGIALTFLAVALVFVPTRDGGTPLRVLGYLVVIVGVFMSLSGISYANKKILKYQRENIVQASKGRRVAGGIFLLFVLVYMIISVIYAPPSENSSSKWQEFTSTVGSPTFSFRYPSDWKLEPANKKNNPEFKYYIRPITPTSPPAFNSNMGQWEPGVQMVVFNNPKSLSLLDFLHWRFRESDVGDPKEIKPIKINNTEGYRLEVVAYYDGDDYKSGDTILDYWVKLGEHKYLQLGPVRLNKDQLKIFEEIFKSVKVANDLK